MRKTLLLVAFFAQIALVSAQVYVDGVKLEASNTGQYLELDPMYRADGRCAFKVDYGQPNPNDDYVTDSANRRYDFRSLVDGLNFFYQEGWEVTQITVQDRGRRFLLKRRF
jgi:hypothetical protein